MQEYFFPDELILTCPTCNHEDGYYKGSNAAFGPGIFLKTQGLVVALCPRRHQFTLPDDEAYKHASSALRPDLDY